MFLTITLTISLALPAFAMDLGFAAPSFDASVFTRTTTQQVELTVNLAGTETAAAQPPIVSEGGNLNGGSGDINTIIVQGGTPIVGLGKDVRQTEYLPTNWKESTVDNNYGIIDTNNGTVRVNRSNGYVATNNGTVETNEQGGTVVRNTGTLKNNYSTVKENNGTVTYNYSGGTVQANNGTVSESKGAVTINEQSGTIVSMGGGTVETNRGTINALVGGTVETNNGLIDRIEKNGIVQTNQKDGIIITNRGTVWYNAGIIETNNLDVWGNAETIFLNNGTVTDNLNLVKENKGTISSNMLQGSIVEKNEGTVTNNYGTVDNYPGGIVETNYADGIVFNYGGKLLDNLGIELFRVTISRSANTSVTDAADGLVAHNGEAWKEAGNISGAYATVTISPAAGYTITNIAAVEGINPVQNADGSWTVTVDASLVNEGQFTLDTEVQENEAPGSTPSVGGNAPDPYYYGRHSEPSQYDDAAYFADILSLLNITMEPAVTATAYNAGPDAFDSFNAETLAAVADAPADGVVEIDLRKTGWTTLKRDVFEAAAARGDVTIIIYYNQLGRDYTLTIPAGTDLSAITGGAQYLDASQLPALLNLTAV